ncbi:MAG: M3 family metallopeptidase [Hymenobacteraceae bacterium]|nr:M3 family metallopeptidase [Hymenobacteraceae bacterium]MDX5397848.1 M3 family metallopeptidase [Hymenobacteraceae bacterium]MDX5513919.1 M3 family metallopeptidase [Hymenobacteraceae bacterium]
MNPLLAPFNTPYGTAPFHLIKPQHYLPAIEKSIELAKQEIEEIKSNKAQPTFSNTIEALEQSGELLDQVSQIFFNLNSAETNDEIQQLARQISPLLSAYGNDVMLDEHLFKRVKQVWDNHNPEELTAEQRTLLDKTYKSFVRNGANLSDEDKNRLREIDEQLSRLSLEFGEHVLAETNAYELVIENEEELKGLPESVREAAALTAKEKGYEGKWMFTLHFPSYFPFITYSENRELREKLYCAYNSRGYKNNENDNREVVKQIVKLRYERALLLGYQSHADFVLEERMAENPEKVKSFLNNLLHHARPRALQELKELTAFAKEQQGPDLLQRWDTSFYAEKLKKKYFAIDDELLKPFFQLERVVEGVFALAGKLYGLTFKENKEIPVYHPDVKVYEVEDEKGGLVGIFYADFFPRAGKRNGAWMTSFRSQRKKNGEEQRPHVAIVCNFTKPTQTKPSLLTFNEVKTLFHEFGHALHGLLAEGTYASLSGTSVYWDFVELPSQVLENWTYQKECLDLFARHYQTGELIPEEIMQKIKDSANFMVAYATLRQLGLARLDMAWHDSDPKNIQDVGQFEQDVLEETDLLPPVYGTNISCAFSHIFQGGYSSGYYSYKWAEVRDADAFEFFQETGVFNKETAMLFRQHILSAGGSEHPMELYKRFRGKEPSPEALLRRTGLLQSS